jgi:hypothetical protein
MLRFDSNGWRLATDEVKTGRSRSITNLCQQIATIDGIERIAMECRNFPAAQYSKEILRQGDQAAQWLAAEHYELVTQSELTDSMKRDVLVTITVNAKKVSREIDDAGGGVEGMSVVLGNTVTRIARLLPVCGLRKETVDWFNAGEIRAAIKLAFDPTVATTLELNDWQVPAETKLVDELEDHPTYIVTDNTWHRVYWVESWPRTPVDAGFMERLCNPPMPATITMLFEAQDLRKTEKRVESLNTSRGATKAVNRFLGRRDNTGYESEGTELELRRQEIMDGHNDVNFQGYVTLHAPSYKDLDNGGDGVRAVTPGMNLVPLRGQQWPAFATAALPLGLGARK